MATQPILEPQPTVFLITPWYGGSGGGVAISSETIAGALMGLGIRVIVLAFDSLAPHRGRFGEPVLPVVCYGKDVKRAGVKGWLGYWRRLVESGLTLAKLKLRYPTAVAHFQYCMPAFAPLRIWCRILRVPVIMTFRGSDVNEVEAGSCAADEVSAMIRDAATVTAVSEGLLIAVHERFPESRHKSCVVRNVIPLDIWESSRCIGSDDCRDIDILYLGNIENIKGPDLLLAAFRHLLQRRPATSLRFVGSGIMEEEIHAAVSQAGLDDHVTFSGRAQRSEVVSWLRRARVLALPSRAEGLPLSAIEAQLLGVPVVAHAVGGVPQAVADERTGLLVPLGDASAFARAMERLLVNEQEWREFSARAMERASTHFNPERMARQYADLYTRVMQRTSRFEATSLHRVRGHV